MRVTAHIYVVRVFECEEKEVRSTVVQSKTCQLSRLRGAYSYLRGKEE